MRGWKNVGGLLPLPGAASPLRPDHPPHWWFHSGRYVNGELPGLHHADGVTPAEYVVGPPLFYLTTHFSRVC